VGATYQCGVVDSQSTEDSCTCVRAVLGTNDNLKVVGVGRFQRYAGRRGHRGTEKSYDERIATRERVKGVPHHARVNGGGVSRRRGRPASASSSSAGQRGGVDGSKAHRVDAGVSGGPNILELVGRRDMSGTRERRAGEGERRTEDRTRRQTGGGVKIKYVLTINGQCGKRAH
jgi:hypothetical protein